MFSFFAKKLYSRKICVGVPTRWQRGQQLSGHCVSIVNDSEDAGHVSAQSTITRTYVVSAQSMTMPTHGKLFYLGKKFLKIIKSNKKCNLIFLKIVSAQSLNTQTSAEIVNDYALRRHGQDFTRTLQENFEGFIQILKEHSGGKSYLAVFTNPIAII